METNADTNLSERMRKLPQAGRLLEALQEANNFPAALCLEAVREALEEARAAIRAGAEAPSFETLAAEAAQRIEKKQRPSLRGAINATGVVLHTGLGRARLAHEAVLAVQEAAANHSLLEIEAESGRRGSRTNHVRELLQELTGAEDALVVNNCAGAVFLAITALATGCEVILSRGELVEIGGAFRMPDIIRSSGAQLVEVGTTNRTRLADYRQAITENTGLILRCRPSNFAIIGFTEAAPLEELAALGKEHGIPVMDDQGSGALLDFTGRNGGLRESVEAGCSLITSSGDKLLGGPQAGLVLGNREQVAAIARHPLARALRVDKLTLAALEATLRLYREPERARLAIPTLRYLGRTQAELRVLAGRLLRRLRSALPAERFSLSLLPAFSEVGGGSLPDERLPTVCVALRSAAGGPSPDRMAALLRTGEPPLFARIQNDSLLFDPRTLEEEEIALVAKAAGRLADC